MDSPRLHLLQEMSEVLGLNLGLALVEYLFRQP
jgi:hypothetical protein